MLSFEDIIAAEGGLDECISMMNENSDLAHSFTFRILNRILQPKGTEASSELQHEAPAYSAQLLEALKGNNLNDFVDFVSHGSKPHEEITRSAKKRRIAADFAGSFRQPYVGPAADMLFEYLWELNFDFIANPARYYAKLCSIVQSSGTGKSRTILQLKEKNVIVVYINIRHSNEISSESYPLRDDIPADILTTDLGCSEGEYSDRCMAFLTGLFEVLEEWLGALSKMHRSRDGIVKAWSDDMCNLTDQRSRSLFFAEVEKHYALAFSEIKLASMSGSEGVEAPVMPKGTASATPFATSSSDEILGGEDSKASRRKEFGRSIMRAAYQDMLGTAGTVFVEQETKPQMVIAFDGAHPLLVPQTHFLPLHILSLALREVSRAGLSFPVCTIFASTTPEAADFVAPDQIHTSARVFASDNLLFPPYSNFGWDQRAPALEDVKPNEVARFNNIAGFGRPLWSSMVDAGLSQSEILTMAGQKLTNSIQFDEKDRHQALAVIGQRFLLDICLGQYDSSELLHTAVSSHLRVCLSTSEDRTLIETAYPSEPLLSCAAAQLLYADTDSKKNLVADSLSVIKTAVSSQAVARDDNEASTSRLTFLLSKDQAVRMHFRDTPPDSSSALDELLDCKPIPVIVFLECLFGNNKVTPRMKLVFEGWYINFSHWIAARKTISFEESSEVEERKSLIQEWLLRNWTRTCAIQCAPLQSAFDKVIPMYHLQSLENPGTTSFSEHVSFILISDKAKDESSESTLEENWLDKAELPSLGQPYIAIVADLGLEHQQSAFTLKETSAEAVLNIYASGLGSDTYPQLSESVIAPLREILRGPSELDKAYLERRTIFNKQLEYGGSLSDVDTKWEGNQLPIGV
ncbi:hypothetical protein RhiJN_25690 [Ceratobasidium sp. AG-Ba]|nr:hypothetical protein RhiJN_25690 [Ceratobasidium sp. AG-Ba]